MKLLSKECEIELKEKYIFCSNCLKDLTTIDPETGELRYKDEKVKLVGEDKVEEYLLESLENDYFKCKGKLDSLHFETIPGNWIQKASSSFFPSDSYLLRFEIEDSKRKIEVESSGWPKPGLLKLLNMKGKDVEFVKTTSIHNNENFFKDINIKTDIKCRNSKDRAIFSSSFPISHLKGKALAKEYLLSKYGVED